jgi:hypothetical protein
MLLVPVAAALVLALFAWPQARMKPHDLPVGVAGPPPATAQIAHELEAQDGAFEVHRYTDEADARAGIADREIYGAAGAGHAAVLAAWALAGLGALLLAGARGRRLATRPAAVPA